MQRPIFSFVLLVSLAACHRAPPGSEPPAAEASAPSASTCSPSQFVACQTGEACARRHGKLIRPHACHDRAASACEAAACVHGCDVYRGEPKEVHCAPNAASTGHMKKCAGFANWGCPENMTCKVTEPGLDVMGTCVPVDAAD